MQIVAYGSQDLFLTSKPQITFFKAVYKRYTNFSLETIEVQLDNNLNFDTKSDTLIPKTGDLISRIYLKIVLPTVNITSQNIVDNSSLTTLQNSLSTYETSLIEYKSFIKYNFIIINNIKQAIKIINFNWDIFINLLSSLKTSYISTINNINVNLYNVINRLEQVFPLSSKNLYFGSDINNNLLISTIKSTFDNLISDYTQKERNIYDTINDIRNAIDDINNTNECFSWIDDIGFNIIKQCDISIGGNKIATFDADYLKLYYSLNKNILQQTIFNKMIGNYPDLTAYNNKVKQSKTLYIPIPAWFTLHYGCSIPLIALKYHDVEFSIQLNSINDCCYYRGNINLNNILSVINSSILIDYIYIENEERKKFAQYTHEYLMQNVQQITMKNISINSFTISLEFAHIVKELLWVFKTPYLFNRYKINTYNELYIFEILSIALYENNRLLITYNNTNINYNYFSINSIIHIKYNKYYEGQYIIIGCTYNTIIIGGSIQYNKYTYYDDDFYGIIYNDGGQITNLQSLQLDGQDLIPLLDSKYFNYVQPYKYYRHTPMDGCNVYSFSLYPEKYQPSGGCNFSVLQNKTLKVIIKDIYHQYLVDNNYLLNIIIYATNYNILRIYNGMSSLVFS